MSIKALKGVLIMLIRNLIFLLLSFPLFAQVDFPKGKCELEGKLTQERGLWFLEINPNTNSQIKLRLLDYSTKEENPPQYVKAQVLFEKNLASFVGEVKLVKIIREINPFRGPERYTSQNIKKACSL